MITVFSSPTATEISCWIFNSSWLVILISTLFSSPRESFIMTKVSPSLTPLITKELEAKVAIAMF